MEEVNGALEAFADPSFQILLVEAQKATVSTERSADYDLLSELPRTQEKYIHPKLCHQVSR